MAVDVLDELLDRFAATGPEFNGGLSNHGPMAAEALVALGRADAAVSWSEWYAERLLEHPHRVLDGAPDVHGAGCGDARLAQHPRQLGALLHQPRPSLLLLRRRRR